MLNTQLKLLTTEKLRYVNGSGLFRYIKSNSILKKSKV